jgi:hypothetical protein
MVLPFSSTVSIKLSNQKKIEEIVTALSGYLRLIYLAFQRVRIGEIDVSTFHHFHQVFH